MATSLHKGIMVNPEQIHTIRTLKETFAAAGVEAGQTLLLHSSMSKIGGWICGGAEAVIAALQDVLGAEGTLVMPTHTAENTDPAYWQNPPVPQEWWEIIRQERPPFDPATSKTYKMGIIPETFRSYPGVLRSNHPIGSFASAGKHARAITAPQPLEPMFGEDSPIGRLVNLGAKVLLLGVSYDSCTSLHLAEYRMRSALKRFHTEGCAVLTESGRRWVNFEMMALDSDDFEQIGAQFEQTHPQHVRFGQIGNAATRLIEQRPLVDFAHAWMEQYRTEQEDSV
jgi:aminoglycoside 3-N-acetyltransferase